MGGYIIYEFYFRLIKKMLWKYVLQKKDVLGKIRLWTTELNDNGESSLFLMWCF